MASTWIAAAVAVTVALMSALVTYMATKRLSRRDGQIVFIGRQLSEFYGQLFALSKASSTAWAEFGRRYGYTRSPLFLPSQISSLDQDPRAWKYWLRHVFMPINRRMLDIILLKMDLVEGEVLECLIDFCSHVTGLEVALAQWEDEDYSTLSLVVPHPGTPLDDYIKTKYEDLKTHQATLLGEQSQLISAESIPFLARRMLNSPAALARHQRSPSPGDEFTAARWLTMACALFDAYTPTRR